MSEEGRNRLRAARACQACSSRKVRCDVTEVGLPCSRCRVARTPNCHLVASRRGTYKRQRSQQQTMHQSIVSLSTDTDAVSSTRHHASLAEPCQSNTAVFSPPSSVDSAPQGLTDAVADGGASLERTGAAQPQTQDSLTSMFERFIEQQGHNVEDAANKCGIMFMSGASPLTFALEEARNQIDKAVLHDADSHFIKAVCTGPVECTNHPSHLSPQDIGYLKAKGAFERPTNDVCDAMVTAFTERFYPSYSIVDLSAFNDSFKARTLPWILLHAVCFIGSTFCDLSKIHQAGFKGRWHARRHFYDKAKLLFDTGYETNKIVLLQTVIMLSFWGPQMKSYWNPCSWVGFGVTIAESLGIHRLNTSIYMDRKRRSLLKRLFWVLAVRDAYCATLLGRPCRLNIVQCDTEPLGLDDFHDGQSSGSEDQARCQSHAHYQIQVSKLSLILRGIMEARFGPAANASMTDYLHNQMEKWKSELPSSISWLQQQALTTNVFALSLKIIFHLQLILIHLQKPEDVAHIPVLSPGASTSASEVTESAAHIIASTAFTIMVNSMLDMVPHEIFSGFFIASIVFYRGTKHAQGSLTHLPRSALDNCQMLISEARERWDPANWVLRIFDFLPSSNIDSPDTAQQIGRDTTMSNNIAPESDAVPMSQDGRVLDIMPEDDILHCIDFGSPTYQSVGSMANELFLMSNYLTIPSGNPPFMPM
ncbi:hypothetical protein BGZ61DRAFT_372695 [Ilyonectria robusta]|uniref:uncharacterized protein n=1 Tax=Ilyonectria robusta TaxID=1079257 RepID=UPI001E8DE49E|nr:uncharacterized protein BGZ61DRAFT_372695 [Ilyonectria robusta]KAH8656261.1 hypothetical protein BGZ61DRAFT_372695 [Ilyonectria robusta]